MQRALALGLLLVAGPASASTPLGLWINQKQTAVVRVAPCETGLCARIVWLAKPYRKDGTLKRDAGQPWCGLTVVRDWRPGADAAAWAAGTVHDPASGATYRGRLRLSGDSLEVRGFVLVPLLGRTLVWRRVASVPGACPRSP